MLAVRFEDEGELVVSERVTRKSVRVRLLPAADFDEDFARYGPEPLDPSFDDAALETALARGGQLHTLLRDQHALVGIGRAYANEILHAAELAPFTPADRLSPEERARLLAAIQSTLTDGIERFRPRGPRMVAKKHNPEVYDIHGHAGESCPRCGSTLHERRLRRPPGRLLPVLPDRRPGLRRPPPLAPAQVTSGKRTLRRSPSSSTSALEQPEHAPPGVGAQVALEQLRVESGQRAERDRVGGGDRARCARCPPPAPRRTAPPATRAR